MKLRSLIIAMASLTISLTIATAQTFITNGLVAYYPFNGNANDASGNGNNGTVNGATLTQDRFGDASSAYNFNGINNFIGFAGVPMSQVDNWTMTAWVKPASTNQVGIAVALGFDDGNTANGYSLGISAANGVPGNQVFAVFGNVGDFTGGFAFTSTNQWYQVVMSRKSGTTSFYVNGNVTPNGTTASPSTPTAFRIGSNSGVRFFNGAIDDVRIYNRALTTNEIAELYSEESGFCSPHAAEATAQVVNGFVIGANIIDGGCGYTNAPEVLIVGGSGSGATATATIQNGFVTAINITNPGSGYTNPPDIEIASPPFVPTLTINVSRVNVTQHVVLGLNYVLESSTDMVNWTPTGPQFTAQSETITTEFVVSQTGQFFRIRQVP
jgi:Concanavalin A-like lectin/glucanases superfamily